ncbi:hypothetical protein MSBRW_2016 [Methanosarcina barkeri str. Wiesmoor]|uniref:Uncharacterized protein n=1 Tax=Methanosarcina barkeri str. Wiesmoor TaxID=1434109 RepID=A0A0E3QLX8_METBA|nr:hypothetical protein MSBRW_2016 [Methanosarcina barkeri str. Wiesmoor]
MVETTNLTLLAFSRLIYTLFFGALLWFHRFINLFCRRDGFSKLKVLNENRIKIKNEKNEKFVYDIFHSIFLY